MKRVIRHRLTISMATAAVCLIAATFVSGDAYPVAMAMIWAVYVVTLAFAIVAMRRDLKNA
jgi:fatty acid desaturase